MNPYVIIGGGLCGLLTAQSLKRRGIPFVLLEKSDSVGGRVEVGHHRLYAPSTREFLSGMVQGIEWREVTDAPKLRRKGEWNDLDEEASDEEKFYLKYPFFSPKDNFSSITTHLRKNLSEQIQLRKEVTEINPEKKIVVCQDGSTIEYDKVIWCNSLPQLRNIWMGDKLSLLRLLKKTQMLPGGINLTLETDRKIFPSENSIVFPFRFKDKKLRAIGVERQNAVGATNPFTIEWLLFLDEEIAEDREEVAKCLRTMRREIEKEFTGLKAAIKQERIVYLSQISGESPVLGESLEILPDVYYVGSQLSVSEADEELRNLDLAVTNFRHWEQGLPA